MNILFTLCGRAGSKGVTSKNIRTFCGVPLSYYSLACIDLFRQAHHTEHARMDIALSTDSPELIRQLLQADDGIFVIQREAALAGDMVRKIDVIRDAAKRAAEHYHTSYDMVVDLDITSPLRTLLDLEHVVEKRMTADADIDVIYTVTEARRSPYFNMVSKQGKYYDRVFPSTFATRQEAPELFDMNASIYAYSGAFMNSDNPFFDRADIVLMMDTGILDIDSEWDYQLMQGIAAFLYKELNEYHRVYKKTQRY